MAGVEIDGNLHARWVDALTKVGVPPDKIAEALTEVARIETASLNEMVERLRADLQ